MKYFFDTEFIEDGKTIDLISIGIVSESGEILYACNSDCDLSRANDWVEENVISQLPGKNDSTWMTRKQIAFEVLCFIKGDEYGYSIVEQMSYDTLHQLEMQEKPEFWAYYADYDWVVFCQLFGKMIDLPNGFPMYCKDIKQECDRLGNPRLPKQESGEHNAIKDAIWNKESWEFLNNLK